jgi:hypothetical protein
MLLTNQKNINYEIYMKYEREPPPPILQVQRYNRFLKKLEKNQV